MRAIRLGGLPRVTEPEAPKPKVRVGDIQVKFDINTLSVAALARAQGVLSEEILRSTADMIRLGDSFRRSTPPITLDMLCEHANEVPSRCHCPRTCACKSGTCAPRPPVPVEPWTQEYTTLPRTDEYGHYVNTPKGRVHYRWDGGVTARFENCTREPMVLCVDDDIYLLAPRRLVAASVTCGIELSFSLGGAS